MIQKNDTFILVSSLCKFIVLYASDYVHLINCNVRNMSKLITNILRVIY